MKPMFFNAEMTRRVLENRKTVMRRVIKPHNPKACGFCVTKSKQDGLVTGVYDCGEDGQMFGAPQKPPYSPGDILYVRESFCEYEKRHIVDGVKYAYKADATAESERARKDFGYKWRPSIHMPREAARIFLRVTNVRVERLQDITENEAQKEGLRYYDDICRDESWHPTFYDPDSGRDSSTVKGFSFIWDSTIKPQDRALYGWNANPWVWVIEFERISREEAVNG